MVFSFRGLPCGFFLLAALCPSSPTTTVAFQAISSSWIVGSSLSTRERASICNGGGSSHKAASSSSSDSSQSSPFSSSAASSNLFRNSASTNTPQYVNGATPSATVADAVSFVGLEEQQQSAQLSNLVAWWTKIGMLAFIASMCVALPLTLYPQKALFRLGLIDQKRKERWALATSQFCARTLSRIFPFYRLETVGGYDRDPQPAIWACNHTSMLDVFILMAADQKLRGPKRRPIKIVYWKDLEANPVTGLMFRQCGFIPVAMAPNKPGEDNEYDKASFKLLLKDVKKAFEEDFDVALLPEGQLNPTPELGLQPVFGGAYTLAKMSRRPVYMLALYGIHKLWHPNAAIGMTVTGRDVKIRNYPNGRQFSSADEFKETFETVVGQFGATGKDLPEQELEGWLSGSAWAQKNKE